MHNWRLILIIVAAGSFAASAHAQTELIESVESLKAADDASSFESFEQISDEIAEDDFTSAEWSDAGLPDLIDDVADGEASAPWGSFYAGAELLLLKPRYSMGSTYGSYLQNLGLLSGFNGAGIYKDDPDDAPRAFIGWESVGGLGVRGRFWEFENGGLLEPEYQYSGIWRTDGMRFDVDVYRRLQFNRGSVAAGANLSTVDLNIDGFYPDNASYDATGLGVFVDGRHTLYESDRFMCSLIGRGRWSQLMGKHTYDVTIYPSYYLYDDYVQMAPTVERIRDDADLQIAEAAAGFELVRKFRYAALAFQYAVEVQNWSLNPAEELSFLGSTFSLGLQR